MQQNPNQRMMMNQNANVSQSNLLQQRLTQQRMGVSQAGPMQPRPGVQQQIMINRMPMHQGGPGGPGGPGGMPMMRPSTAPPVYSINASPQMAQGSSPMMMPTPSPHSHFVPSPQQNAGVPSPGQRMSMAPSPQGSIRPGMDMNSQNQNDDQAYLAKVQQLSKYIEPLKKMIAKIGNEDQEKLGKMKKLMDILSNPTKRLDYHVLLRCESVLEHMIRDAPPDPTGQETSGGSSINPLLDSVLKLKRLNSSQSMNHSMYRTFGPPLEAISGAEITLAPPVKRRRRMAANTDTEENQLPDHIQGEVAQLHSQFKVALDPSHVVLLPNDSIQLQCHLEDRDLPSVPPILVTLGPNYPLESSPDLHDNAEEYEKSQFLRSVRQALESRVKKLPARHTLTQLLTAWEMGVRSACSFKKRPGSPTIPLVTNFSEIATV